MDFFWDNNLCSFPPKKSKKNKISRARDAQTIINIYLFRILYLVTNNSIYYYYFEKLFLKGQQK